MSLLRGVLMVGNEYTAFVTSYRDGMTAVKAFEFLCPIQHDF